MAYKPLDFGMKSALTFYQRPCTLSKISNFFLQYSSALSSPEVRETKKPKLKKNYYIFRKKLCPNLFVIC